MYATKRFIWSWCTYFDFSALDLFTLYIRSETALNTELVNVVLDIFLWFLFLTQSIHVVPVCTCFVWFLCRIFVSGFRLPVSFSFLLFHVQLQGWISFDPQNRGYSRDMFLLVLDHTLGQLVVSARPKFLQDYSQWFHALMNYKQASSTVTLYPNFFRSGCTYLLFMSSRVRLNVLLIHHSWD